MNDAPEAIGQPTESAEVGSGRPEDGAEWLSVTQLAERRGISRASAARLIRRYKWPRRVDNLTRTTSYLVPTHAMEESGRPTEAAAVTALREAVDLLRDQFAVLETERDDLRRRLEEKQDALRVTEQQAMRAELAHATAQEALRQMEQREAVRRARGRWARLRAAWRGE